MMIIDTMEALEFLRQHGIRVAQTRYVDSSEDAIFFAGNRPIALCVLAGNPKTPLHTTDAIKDTYEHLSREAYTSTGGHVLAQQYIESGTDIAIEAYNDDSIGRIVELQCGTHRAYRLHPLTKDLAEAMLTEFRSKRNIAGTEKSAHMLEHLLLKVSEIYEDQTIVRLSLNPVRLHGNTYDVLDTKITTKGGLNIRPRLAPHAHDKKAFYKP
jgi:ATP-grasp domain